MDMTAAIALGGQALTLLKELNKVDKEFDKTELKLKIGDLVDKTVAMKIALSEAQDALAVKDKEIEQLKGAMLRKTCLIDHDGFLYQPDDAGKPKGDPFCPRCDQRDGRLMKTVSGDQWNKSICPDCKSEYYCVNLTKLEEHRTQQQRINAQIAQRRATRSRF